MTPENLELQAIVRRLGELEGQNRRLKWGGITVSPLSRA